jgi:hypothetical protein
MDSTIQYMQSPAPEKQRIRRSDSSEETKEAFDIIENIEVVTEEEDKKQEAESDLSDSTITEDKDLPETEGGSIKQTVTVAAEALAIPASTSGVVGTSKSSSSSSSSTSTSLSSTGGSSKSDISSLDSSDSSGSYSSDLDLDLETSAADKNKKKKYKYNKMPSSLIIKSPVSGRSRATFEEWHSLWEVFGQE